MLDNIFNTELTFLMTPERRFKELFQNLAIKIDEDRYPNTIFWFRGDNVIFDYDKKSGYFYCNYMLVWSVFESEFGLNYDQISKLIKGRVEEHFKLKDATPLMARTNWTSLVEEHFKLKDATPKINGTTHSILVEEHFKLKDATPLTLGHQQSVSVEEHFKLKDATPLSCNYLR